MPIKLLHHKSFHPYKAENIARVKRDEAAAQLKDEENDRRMSLADSEARLDRMRSSIKKKEKRDKRALDQRGERELERQLRGERSVPDEESGRDDESGTRIVRPDDKGKARESEAVSNIETNGHLNFWADLEAGKAPPIDEARVKKALEQEKMESMTRMYIAKRGEGDPKGWYASADGKTDQERKESVEVTLERAYKDGEQKRLTDPLAQMNAYLARRHNVLHGRAEIEKPSRYRERYREPATRDEPSPIAPSLLAPKRRRGEAPPVASSSSSKATALTVRSSSIQTDPAAEAAARVSAERARAAAILAEKRRLAMASSASSVASTPRSEYGGNLFNAAETREAQLRRQRQQSGGGRLSWEEMRRLRQERGRGTAAQGTRGRAGRP